MATELQFNKDDEDKDQQSGSVGPASASGPSPSGNASAPPAHASTPSGRPNIKQYLQANQGAGQQLAQGIQGGVEKQASQLSQGVNKAKTGFEAGANPLEQNLGEQGTQKIQTAFKDPSAILNQQNQLSEFQKLRDQGYNQDISNLQTQFGTQQQQLQSQAGKLGQKAQNAGTEAGRFDLLQNTFGQPNYSKGQQKLDQLFLQAQPGAARGLQQNLQGINQQANQQVTGLSNDAQAKLQALQGLSGQRSQDIQNLLQTGTSADQLESDISGRGLQDINASSQDKYAQAQAAVAQVPGLRDRLAKNQLTTDDMSALGLQKGTSLYDVDLSHYMNQNDKQATLANTSDPAEFARYRALQQLSGDTSGDIYGGATEAGGFKPYNYDLSGAQSGLNFAKNQYETENVNNLVNQLRNSGALGNVGTGSSGTGLNMSGLNKQLAAMQAQQEKTPSADYYGDVRKAISKAFKGHVNPLTNKAYQSGVYGNVNRYQDVLNKQRANILGGNDPETEK